jgi:hypothetical protein
MDGIETVVELIDERDVYVGLTDNVAKAARADATLIRSALKKGGEQIFEVGAALNRMKETLHGRFERWLEQEFNMTARTAQNYMKVARHLSDVRETVSGLPPKALYLLASESTPSAARDHIRNHLENGEKLNYEEVKCHIDYIKEVAMFEADEAQRMAEPTLEESKEEAKKEKSRAKRRQTKADREAAKAEAAKREEAERQRRAELAATFLCNHLKPDQISRFLNLMADVTWYDLQRRLQGNPDA